MGGHAVKAKPKHPVPRQSAERLAEIARLFADNLVFSTAHMSEGEAHHAHLVFMPLALGALADTAVEDVGVLWEEYSKALQTSINGMPIFSSFHVLHRDDWAIVRRELVARQAEKDRADAESTERIARAMGAKL